jgi:hypothetical protein
LSIFAPEPSESAANVIMLVFPLQGFHRPIVVEVSYECELAAMLFVLTLLGRSAVLQPALRHGGLRDTVHHGNAWQHQPLYELYILFRPLPSEPSPSVHRRSRSLRVQPNETRLCCNRSFTRLHRDYSQSIISAVPLPISGPAPDPRNPPYHAFSYTEHRFMQERSPIHLLRGFGSTDVGAK